MGVVATEQGDTGGSPRHELVTAVGGPGSRWPVPRDLDDLRGRRVHSLAAGLLAALELPHRSGLRSGHQGRPVDHHARPAARHPEAILIIWPLKPTVVAPAKFQATVSSIVKVLAAAQISSTPRDASAVDDAKNSSSKIITWR
jgi:hypothetical protein